MLELLLGLGVIVALGAGAETAGALIESSSSGGTDFEPTPDGSVTDFDSLFQQYGDANGVPWIWLKAFAMNESNLGRAPSVARGLADPTDIDGSVSTDGKSWGLMQLTLATAGDYDSSVDPSKLNHAEYSIGIAAQFIAHLANVFPIVQERRLEWIVKSYNQGEGNTQKEINGQISGYAQAYYERWVRNYAQIGGTT